MFLEIPVLLYYEDSENTYEADVDINPFHVVSIEPYSENKKHCLVILQSTDYEVRMTRTALKKVVADFVKENILSKIYKSMKDDQSN
jgi:hypothetical protein